MDRSRKGQKPRRLRTRKGLDDLLGTGAAQKAALACLLGGAVSDMLRGLDAPGKRLDSEKVCLRAEIQRTLAGAYLCELFVIATNGERIRLYANKGLTYAEALRVVGGLIGPTLEGTPPNRTVLTLSHDLVGEPPDVSVSGGEEGST